MMTVCRYASAIAVFLVVSLTPRSCSDLSEEAMAADEPKATVVNETVHAEAENENDTSSNLGDVYDIGS